MIAQTPLFAAADMHIFPPLARMRAANIVRDHCKCSSFAAVNVQRQSCDYEVVSFVACRQTVLKEGNPSFENFFFSTE